MPRAQPQDATEISKVCDIETDMSVTEGNERWQDTTILVTPRGGARSRAAAGSNGMQGSEGNVNIFKSQLRKPWESMLSDKVHNLRI